MKNIKLLLLFFMSICFLSSCVMHKPMGDIGAPDYNKRQLITKASYSKRATKLGIGITVGTTVAGGVVGAVTQPVKLNTSEGAAKPVPAANAAVGAAIGYGITSFINHIILKQGRNGIPIDHQNNWIRKKYGNDKIFLRNENKGFWIVDRSIEDNFIVKNMQDVNDFFSAFPDAILYNKDRVIAQAIKEVDRSDLPTLLVLVPQTNHKQDLQEKYLSLSKNLEDLYEAIDRFPSLKSNAEQSIVAKTSNVTEAVKFARIYPNSIYNKQIIIKIFDEKSTVSEVKRIKGLYPNDFFITESDLKKLTAHNSDKEGYFHALYLYKDITTKSGLLKLADEYNWLNFTNKGSSILSYYWDIQYPNFSDGNRLVAATYYFSNDEGKKYGTTSSVAKEVIFEKLSKEIENNVSIVSQNVMESYNASWEEWKRNTTLTAAFVSEEGAADYLIYGEIRNNSKFDLPIELLVEGDLFMIEDLSAKEGSSGAVLRDVTKSIVKAMEGDKAAKAYQKALDEATTKKSFLKKGSQKYYIPYLPAKQKNLYAIFIPFGNMTKKSGTNIMESYNFTKTLKFENTPVKIDIFKGTTSTTQLNKQKDWLKMSKNGLPNANLMDTWRGITYNASDWEMKYQEQQEEMRRWREEQRRLEQETTEQSESVDYTDDVKISIRKEKSHENSINIYIDNDDWFMEDAEYTIVTITPNEGSYEDAERYDQNNDISKTYKNAKSVEVTITYKVGGKIQSGSRIINGKGDWKITIDD